MSGSGREQTLLGLIAARDPDAAAGFYDARASSVRRYCEEVCPAERLDEATLAAFVDFLGRVAVASADAGLEDLLEKATRTAAASRMELTNGRQPECHAMPDLMAAKVNGELARDDERLRRHLRRCPTCRETAERLVQANEAWTHPAAEAPPVQVRSAWLEVVARQRSAAASAPPAEPPAAGAPPPVIRVRVRRGGLVGAARRAVVRSGVRSWGDRAFPLPGDDSADRREPASVLPAASTLAPPVSVQGAALDVDPGAASVAARPPSPVARRIAGNLTVLTLAEVFARSLTLVTSVVVARVLGPGKLGEVALALTLSVFCSAIADGGLTLLTYRRIVAEPARISRLVVDTTMVQTGIACLMMGVLIAVALVAPFGAGKRELLIVFAPYILSQALNVIYAVQALERMGSAALIKMATQLLTAVPTIAMVVATHDPIWVAVGLIAGQLSGDAITMWVLRRRAGFQFVVPDLSAVIPLLTGGAALLGSLLLFNYLGSIDIPILSAFRPSRQVGVYSSATRIAATAAIVSQVLFAAVLPELVRRHENDHDRFVSFVKQLVALTARLTLVPTAIVVSASGPIVHLIYGHQYHAAAPLLAILIPIVPLVWYGHLLGFVQVAAGRQRDFLVSLAVACGTATIAYPLLAGLGGPTALACGGTAVSVVQAAAFGFLARRLVGTDAAVVAALRQLPYALVPIGLIVVQRTIVVNHSFATSVALWIGGVLAVEVLGRSPSLRLMARIRASRAAT